MTFSTIGDLATSFRMRRDTAQIASELARATAEISSGQTADVVGRLRGDFNRLAGIEGALVRLDGYQSNIDEYGFLLTTSQSVIGKIREIGFVSTSFLSVPVVVNGPALASFGNEGLSAFTTALRALNTAAAGRSVFSGIETDRAAVADAETILTAIEAAVAGAGAVTVADVEATVDTWFSVGGGFDSVGYLGGDKSTTPIRLSDSESADSPVTAEDDAIRETLAALALGALVGRGLLAGNPAEQGALVRRSGERLLVADDALIELQSRIGRREAAVGRAAAEVGSQRDALQLARAELIEVDPFDAATRLQNAELRLRTIYEITGRLSRLSLAEYL